LIKAIAFLVLVAICFIVSSSPPDNVRALPLPTGVDLLVALVIAMQSVIYTYGGWTGLVYFSEELRSPERDIPRAMFGGMLLVIAIYLLVNLALLHVLPISQIAGEKLAVGAAAQKVLGLYGDRFIRILMIISMLGAVNAYQLQATRVLYGMGRDGLFPNRVRQVNRGGTPTVTLLVSTVIALIFLLSSTFERVLAVLAFFFVLNYSMSFISVFVLRFREPNLPRPYRAWGYPWTTGFVLLVSIAFLVGAVVSDTRNSIYALMLIVASFPTFYFLKARSQVVS
jgi:APA family basic amino acid/polyamine antiporter